MTKLTVTIVFFGNGQRFAFATLFLLRFLW